MLGSGGLALAPAARAAGGPIVKPLPPDWFIDYGTNAEMRWSSVYDQGYITSNDRFFVRDHTSTPTIDAATYTLKLHGDGLVGAPALEDAVELTYADLSAMPQRTITSFVECTGNGRSFFGSQQGTTAAGTPWTLGAIGVATWTGVPLRPFEPRRSHLAGRRRDGRRAGRALRVGRRRLRPGPAADPDREGARRHLGRASR